MRGEGIYLEQEPLTCGEGVSTWRSNQSHKGSVYLPGAGANYRKGRMYLPGVGANHRRGGSIYLEWDPITGGKRAYTWNGNQTQVGRDHIPGVGANHRREESIDLEWEPITFYRREESIYLEWEPITGGGVAYTWNGNQS